MPRTKRNAVILLALTAAVACSDGGDKSSSEVTYNKTIAPLIADNCQTCHTTGGLAPFPLLTYDDAKSHAALIKSQTASRTMPPFLADNSGSCQTFHDARWLSEADIAKFATWADKGAPEGEPAQLPTPAEPEKLAVVSTTLDTGVDYQPNAQLKDDYRCFIVDPGLVDKDQYLTAFQVRPGAPSIVHHLIVFSLDTAQAEAQALANDNAEAGPGYTCFGGPKVDQTAGRFLLGWAPGVPVSHYPDGTGVPLPKGRKLVLQVHYNLDHTGSAALADAASIPTDRTRIDLTLVDTVAKPASILPLADPNNLVLPPGKTDASQLVQVDLSKSLALPVVLAVEVWGVFPHMHTLGAALNVEIERNGQKTCLVNVPRWDFHWQQFFQYQKPVTVFSTDTIRLKCIYDTTSRTTETRWGEGSSDEMCLNFSYVTGLPADFRL